MVYINQISAHTKNEKGYNIFTHQKGIELLASALKTEKNIIFDEDMIIFGEKGKPFLKNSEVFFNISHSDGIVACIIDDIQNGIDCEKLRDPIPGVMKRCFCREEIDFVKNSNSEKISFTMLWTLKECYVKKTGQGISTDLKAIAFDLSSFKTFFDCDRDFRSVIINDSFIVSWCLKGNGNIKFDSCQINNLKTFNLF